MLCKVLHQNECVVSVCGQLALLRHPLFNLHRRYLAPAKQQL